MCNCSCHRPDLRPKDGKCDEKQIQECHGDEKQHPCESAKKIRDFRIGKEQFSFANGIRILLFLNLKCTIGGLTCLTL